MRMLLILNDACDEVNAPLVKGFGGLWWFGQ